MFQPKFNPTKKNFSNLQIHSRLYMHVVYIYAENKQIIFTGILQLANGIKRRLKTTAYNRNSNVGKCTKVWLKKQKNRFMLLFFVYSYTKCTVLHSQ